MDNVLLVILPITIIPTLIMSIMLFMGKGSFLIAGLNSMTQEERAKYDERALKHFVAWLLIVVTACVMLIYAGAYYSIAWLRITATIATVFFTTGSVAYMNTGNRFMKKEALKAAELKAAKTDEEGA